MAVSRIIDNVYCLISEYADNFIKFTSADAEKIHIMQKYYHMSKLPNVLGCFDGTHISVRLPSKDKHLFVNRKCFHSKMFKGCVAPISNSKS